MSVRKPARQIKRDHERLAAVAQLEAEGARKLGRKEGIGTNIAAKLGAKK